MAVDCPTLCVCGECLAIQGVRSRLIDAMNAELTGLAGQVEPLAARFMLMSAVAHAYGDVLLATTAPGARLRQLDLNHAWLVRMLTFAELDGTTLQ